MPGIKLEPKDRAVNETDRSLAVRWLTPQLCGPVRVREEARDKNTRALGHDGVTHFLQPGSWSVSRVRAALLVGGGRSRKHPQVAFPDHRSQGEGAVHNICWDVLCDFSMAGRALHPPHAFFSSLVTACVVSVS